MNSAAIKTSSLYLLVFPDRGILKIGKANNVHARSKMLKHFWGDTDYAESFELQAPQSVVFRLEKSLHFMLSGHREIFDSGDGKTEMFSLDSLNIAISHIELFAKSAGGQFELKKGVVVPISKSRQAGLIYPPNRNLKSENLQDFRLMPKALASSALFGVSNFRSAKDRQMVQNKKVLAEKGIALEYTGEELRQDDADVLLQLLHLAEVNKLGGAPHPTVFSVITTLNWSANSDSYNRLNACVERLKSTFIKLSIEQDGKDALEFSGALLGEFNWRQAGCDGVAAATSLGLRKLFKPEFCSLIHWPTRLKLTPTAKWLHSYYSASRKLPIVKTVELHKTMDSGNTAMRNFRYELKATLALLVQCGFFLSAHIDPKSDLVHVERAADRKRLE